MFMKTIIMYAKLASKQHIVLIITEAVKLAKMKRALIALMVDTNCFLKQAIGDLMKIALLLLSVQILRLA